jgi:glycosyltransferase involved in cell wall biosynthesis
MAWACFQLGSREHYAIPAALHAVGRLSALITDCWLSRRSAALARPLAPSLAGRRRDDIPDHLVRHRTAQRIGLDVTLRLRREDMWSAAMLRNAWFGKWAATELRKTRSRCIFSYSYAALEPFREATKQGALRVLSQVDPGPRHFQIIDELTRDYADLMTTQYAPPSDYWKLWAEEVQLADKIIVNSAWSRELLVQQGISEDKITEVPLVYDFPESSENESGKLGRKDNARLQVLFLGSVVLAKGIGQLFSAIELLGTEPVDFVFAGPIGVRVPNSVARCENVRFLGPVDKTAARRLYRESDVLLFPTLSDGFGLVQLEALGNGCPVISSRTCGRVIEDGWNGLLLPEVSPEAIAETLLRLIHNRELLGQLQANAHVPDEFHPRHLAPALLALEPQYTK